MISKILLSILAFVLLIGGLLLLIKNQDVSTQPVSPSLTIESTPSGTIPQGQTRVILTKEGFSPQTITVKAGTKVAWINESGGSATVDSEPHPAHTSYPLLNLGIFQEGKTLSFVFDKPGTYTYHDHLNPARRGTIIVE